MKFKIGIVTRDINRFHATVEHMIKVGQIDDNNLTRTQYGWHSKYVDIQPIYIYSLSHYRGYRFHFVTSEKDFPKLMETDEFQKNRHCVRLVPFINS